MLLYEIYYILMLITFIVSLFCLYYYYNLFATKYRFKNLQMIPQVPIIGSVLQFNNGFDLYNNLIDYPKKYGRNYLAMLGLKPVLITSDAKLLEILFSSSKHINKPNMYRIITGIGSTGLVQSSGDVWRAQRKMMAPTFHYKILEEFIPIFNKHSNQLIQTLQVETNTDSIDVLKPIKTWAIQQVTETVMGLKPDVSTDDTALYRDAGKELFRLYVQRIISPLEYLDCTYFFTTNYQKLLRISRVLESHIHSVIRRKETEYDEDLLARSKKINEDGTKQRIASLDLLIEYKKSGAQLGEVDLRDQVHTLLHGGYDTISTAVALAIYNFAKNPEAQEKALEEVYKILGGDTNQEIKTWQLQEMKYLELCLKESLRLLSTIPLVGRVLEEDVKCDGMTLPKGLNIICSLSALHLDAEYYPEPHKFIPERFTAENCKKRPQYTFLPFLTGQRNCIGHKYATLAMKVCLAKLLLAYEFLSVDHQLQLATEVLLIPKTGVKVGLRRRELNEH